MKLTRDRTILRRLGIAAVGVLLLLVSACGQATASGGSTGSSSAKVGGTLTMATCCQLTSLDPYRSAYSDYAVTMRLYSNLLENTGGSTITCDVCSSWSASADGKTLTFHLLHGIKFQNGSSLNAASVKYSLDDIMGLIDGVPSRSGGELVGLVDRSFGTSQYTDDGKPDGITTSGDYTVQIHLLGASSLVPDLLTSGGAAMVPLHATASSLEKTPDGTGPYRLQSISGSVVTLVRDPDYFKSPLPYISTVRVIAIPDADTAISSVLSGQVELYVTQGSIPPSLLPEVKAAVTDHQLDLHTLGIYDSPDGLILNIRKPPFNNLKVREAVNLAINRTAYSKIVFGGAAEPDLPLSFTTSALPASDVWNVLPGWGTGAKKTAELAEAKTLLTQAGYPNGISGVTLLTINVTQTEQMGEFFAGALAQIGIQATVEEVDPSTFVQDTQAGNFQAGPIFYQHISSNPEEGWLLQFETGAPQNVFGYSDPQVDKLIKEEATTDNPATLKALDRQIQTLILRDLPYIPVTSPPVDVLSSTKLKGLSPGLSQFTSALQSPAWAWLGS
jgi:peptide/nickel transport system substrate-binding protein